MTQLRVVCNWISASGNFVRERPTTEATELDWVQAGASVRQAIVFYCHAMRSRWRGRPQDCACHAVHYRACDRSGPLGPLYIQGDLACRTFRYLKNYRGRAA